MYVCMYIIKRHSTGMFMKKHVTRHVITIKPQAIAQQLPSTAALAHNVTWEMCQCETEHETNDPTNKADHYFYHRER